MNYDTLYAIDDIIRFLRLGVGLTPTERVKAADTLAKSRDDLARMLKKTRRTDAARRAFELKQSFYPRA